MRPSRQAQVVLVTDGLIGFEHEIVSAIFRDNPHGARVHTVGVGSAVNRSLLAPAARAGRGVEIVCGLGEDIEPLVRRLLAHTSAPLVTEVEITCDEPGRLLGVATAKLPDLYAGSPVLVGVKVATGAPGGARLVVRGKTALGDFREEIHVVAEATAHPAVRALFGREAVEDAEMRLAAGATRASIDAEIERLGLTYRISTRHTSFVAVDTVQSVDPRAASRRESMPQALAYGMSAEGLGLRVPSAAKGGGVLASVVPRGPASDGARPESRARVRSESSAMPSPAAPAGPRGGAGAPPPPPPPESPKKAKRVARHEAEAEEPSLLRRAVRVLFGESEGSAPEAAKMDASKEERASSAPASELRGRVKSWNGVRLVVELDLLEELELGLAHGTQVFVRTAGGARLVLALDHARTTADGTYAAGVTLRFVGEVAERTTDQPIALEIEGPAGTLVVALA